MGVAFGRVDSLQRVRHRRLSLDELAAIGERVGRHVEDAHDEGARAELESAGAKAPGEARAEGYGHGEFLTNGKLRKL
jgi:hypothetical protein